jgi:hypothetical protein
MSEPLVIDAGELGAKELLETLEAGRRVVVNTEFLGSEHTVTLRREAGTYYCDTPTRLHTHDSAEEMRECIENQGYAE